MARLVRCTHHGPCTLAVGGEEEYLCRCGLSKNQPFCDGSPKLSQNEADKLYWYDDEGKRHGSGETFSGIRRF